LKAKPVAAKTPAAPVTKAARKVVAKVATPVAV
jgi:hypothetical protein